MSLIQIVSVQSVVNWFGSYRGSGGKDEIGKVEIGKLRRVARQSDALD